MITKTILPLLIITLSSCGQKKSFDCKTILDKVPYFARHNAPDSRDSLKTDREILTGCGSLDSIDAELTSGPFLATILIKYVNENKQITYRSILQSIDEYKKTPEYLKFREAVVLSKTLENKIVTINDWEKDKLLFLKMGLTEEQVSEFKEFIKKTEGAKWNYKNAFTSFLATKEPKITQPAEKLKGKNLVDLDNALRAGQESKKNILIEFTGFACVNSRKMEDHILTDPGVKELISKNYEYFSAYCDDGRPDPGNNNSTIGKKYCKIQSEKFKSSFQPNYFLVDPSGKIIADIGYTPSIEDFKKFLEKGLK